MPPFFWTETWAKKGGCCEYVPDRLKNLATKKRNSVTLTETKNRLRLISIQIHLSVVQTGRG